MNQLAPPSVIDYREPRAEGGALTQTWALLVDAYRDLHSKKLFWITLLLSLLVVGAFTFVSINERGVKIFGWELPGVWNTNFIPKQSFYKFLFVSLAIPYWLGVGASALALISVGGTFPDMLTGGSIDLYLSKPISRTRLFLTKYFCGLLFVALQVFVFCLASFFVIGIRGDAWEFGIFLAVPLVTLFFSYLFCMCVLFGMLTRSALVAILLTLLVWFCLWMLNNADAGLLAFRAAADRRVEAVAGTVKFNQDLLARNASLPEEKRGDLTQYEFQRDQQNKKLAEVEDTARKLRFWQELMVTIKTPLPKTAETVELMSRWLVNPDPFFAADQESHDRQQARRASRGASTRPVDNLEQYMHDPQTTRQISDELNTRSVGWIIGTSVGFELVILAVACWIFARRDF